MDKMCIACGIGLNFDHQDEEFYKKIAPKFGEKVIEMPLPKLCSDCRQIRRQVFRNDRIFYNRKCDLSGKQFISMYPGDSAYKIYHPDEWYSDKWDPMDYGKVFDFERSFLEQFQELMLAVPRLGIDIVNCENSYYCNYCGDDKDCYLDIAGEANEDCYYNLFVKHSKNVVDCTFVYNSELCYESINCYDCYNIQHCIDCDNCSDLHFCYDLIGCRNCLFSSNLRNKQYYIFNKPYGREDYEAYLGKLGLGSFEQRNKLKQGWEKFKLENAIFRHASLINCESCNGDNLKNCNDVFQSFNVSESQDCKYLYDVLDAKDCQDLNYSLYKPELSYELISTLAMQKSAFSMASHYNSEIYYCDMVNNSSNLFGCIGLNHKKYCILNKQYSKQEYDELVLRIIERMNKSGQWGEFFPASLSPFAYNETVANEYYPLSEKEALIKGYKWKSDGEINLYRGPEVKIADDIDLVQVNLTDDILLCEASARPYKVIKEELKFYKKMAVPIPRKAPMQRHKDRMILRNLRRIVERSCAKCAVKISTSYGADFKGKVYCEKCYEQAVY